MTLCIGGPMDGQDYAEQAWQRQQGWFETFIPQRIRPPSPDFPVWPPMVETVETIRYRLWMFPYVWHDIVFTRHSLWLAPGVEVCESTHPHIAFLMGASCERAGTLASILMDASGTRAGVVSCIF